MANLLLDNNDPNVATELRLTPPAEFGEWRPHRLMAKASKLLVDATEPLSKSDLADKMGGNVKDAKDAINFLIADGYAAASRKGKTHYADHV